MADANVWPAYILHSRPYQEDKLLLQLLLPDSGRVSAVIRRRQGKQHRALQPFQLFSVVLVGRSSLKTVRQLEEHAAADLFSGKVLYSGLYINELICRIWPAELSSELLFARYQQALSALAAAQQSLAVLEPCLRQFELSLLDELGLQPDWQYDYQQQPLVADKYYQYIPEAGFASSAQGWPGAALQAIAQGAWQHPGVLPVAKQLTRQLLAPLLGDKPLASRALFSQPEKIKPFLKTSPS